MADPTLSDLVELAGKHARHILIERGDKELIASYLLRSATEVEVLGCPWRDSAEKEFMIKAAKGRARVMKATMASFVTEAWMVERGPENVVGVIPSQEPDRREYVVAYATDGKVIESRAWQIVRDRPGGSIIALSRDDSVTRHAITYSRMLDGLLP